MRNEKLDIEKNVRADAIGLRMDTIGLRTDTIGFPLGYDRKLRSDTCDRIAIGNVPQDGIRSPPN